MLVARHNLRVARSSRLFAPSLPRSSRGIADAKPKSQDGAQSSREPPNLDNATMPNVVPGEEKKEKSPKKTMAELDEELRLKMSGIAGDGGAAGVEYEDGKPAAMKRSVRNNMFRYI